jgi:two-component system, chemotaxis family, protein-glutamate methylesterase/glutaminase
MPGELMIRLLLVEDSAVQRELLLYVLEEVGGFEVVGVAADGEDAVTQAAALRPDVILMDCHLPKMDGIAATRVIMETCPTPIVVATATTLRGDVQFTFEAISNGALAVANKPVAPGTPAYDRVAAQLVRTLRLMSEVKVVRRWPVSSAPSPAVRGVVTPPAPRGVAEMVALTGSTGAPGIIAEILAAVGPALHAPILVVQHMTEGFSEGFGLWLTSRTGVPTQLGSDGLQTRPGHVYLAPDNTHMGVDSTGRIQLSTGPEVDGFRPSATHLLNAVAHAYGARGIGVVLSGMGRDGATGLRDLHHAGGLTIAQDEASSVVFGMPAEAIRLGAAAHVLPPGDIAQLIRAYTSAPIGRGSS